MYFFFLSEFNQFHDIHVYYNIIVISSERVVDKRSMIQTYGDIENNVKRYTKKREGGSDSDNDFCHQEIGK